jgi:hypothetical protein
MARDRFATIQLTCHIVAGLILVRNLSRSVRNLRTVLRDARLAPPLCRLVKDPEERVSIAAASGIDSQQHHGSALSSVLLLLIFSSHLGKSAPPCSLCSTFEKIKPQFLSHMILSSAPCSALQCGARLFSDASRRSRRGGHRCSLPRPARCIVFAPDEVRATTRACAFGKNMLPLMERRGDLTAFQFS